VATNGHELLEQVKAKKPEVVLTDIKMPELDGIEVTKKITQMFPEVGVIALSMFDDDNLVVDMFDAGAKGYLLKNTSKEEAYAAINTVHKGGIFFPHDTSKKLIQGIINKKYIQSINLTEKELQVLKLICQQYAAKEIAQILETTQRAVESIREKLQKKTGAKNMAGLVVFAIKTGLYKI
jgi:DNA-binding NarL/FixJ family response regulator